ncbi:MAG TPA: aldehyde dehydrogenase family protein [Puia sp.]|nr:aldehyde dehydrogenase family protein [Puia sp.]
MKIINPATEEPIQEVGTDTSVSLRRKFEALRSAKPNWYAQPLQSRIGILRRFAEALEKNKDRLAGVLSAEMGKPLQQSKNEVTGAIKRIQWLADNAEQYLSEEWMISDNDPQEKIEYEPLGVVCNISAWNYPFLVGVNVFVPALIAGNAVMYKPSELTMLTGLEIDRLLKQSGVPEDIFKTVLGGGEVGAELLKLPFDGYFFTGSYKTGKLVYEQAAQKMVPCQCELGGKDPLYVADDIADVRAVAASAADGAFYNNGQSCCAVERIYVQEKIYDSFEKEFLAEVRSWKMGSPEEEGVYIGPLSRKQQVAVLEVQVADAVAKGARILTGGKRADRKGYFFEPTVLADTTQNMLVMQEESFGPIIGIMKVRDDQEALEKMKDTEYGLTASVYSSSRERAEHLLKQLNVGTAYWNCCDRVSAAVPWSGRQHSGIGSTLSHIGLRAFTRPKSFHLKKPTA